MLFRPLSDIHTEFRSFSVADTKPAITLLAGDIGVGKDAVGFISSAFSGDVVYVPGNHEYYGGIIQDVDDELASAARVAGIHFLQCGEVVLHGVRILGCTMWTDFMLTGGRFVSSAMNDVRRRISDYKMIRTRGLNGTSHPLTPEDILDLHRQHVWWLTRKISEPFNGKTVVVTHHAPSSRSWPSDKPMDSIACAYASRLDRLMGPGVDLWVHGHTHVQLDYKVNGTRVVCNPRGYSPKALNKDFVNNMVIKV